MQDHANALAGVCGFRAHAPTGVMHVAASRCMGAWGFLSGCDPAVLHSRGRQQLDMEVA